MKYFFLSDGWITGRVWEFGGLWNELGWQRKPHMRRLNLSIQEQGETLWLYQVEETVLMVEVKPESATSGAIGQVVLKRLITADQVIERLATTEALPKSEAQ
ncbi:MAG: hypothetical protein WBA99_17405 [Nodosilinea sp.]